MKRRRPLIIFGAVVALLLATFLLVPLVVVVVSAFSPSAALGVSSEQWAAGAGAGRAFRYVLATYGAHLRTSALLALLSASAALALGLPAGLSLGVAPRTRTAGALEILLTLPLAMPGLTVALALLTAYGAYAGDLGLLVLGHVLYTLPFTVRTVAAAARMSAIASALEAARTLGATRVQRARYLLLPSLRRAAQTSLLLALAVSFGEFNVTFLLATPAHGTFPTALYLTYTTNSFPVAAAATTIFLAGLVPLLAGALWLGGEPQQGA
ncbi:MAG: transporter permease [Myxococcales bacterium]|nr:transporter permease [Myxococcales bacterium]